MLLSWWMEKLPCYLYVVHGLFLHPIGTVSLQLILALNEYPDSDARWRADNLILVAVNIS